MKKLYATLILMCTSFSVVAGWSYNEDQDKMTGKAKKTAVTTSDNSLSLGFPYSGTNYAQLIVRQHPQYGTDVILSIDKGQFLCSTYQGCPIQVRFDDAPPVKFNGAPSADHDSTYIFFKNSKSFITKAKKSKRILIQANIYKSGAPILEFSTNESLKWDTSTPKPKK